jgi:hypothetical protein
MRLNDGDSVVSLALVDKVLPEDEAEDETAEAATDQAETSPKTKSKTAKTTK